MPQNYTYLPKDFMEQFSIKSDNASLIDFLEASIKAGATKVFLAPREAYSLSSEFYGVDYALAGKAGYMGSYKKLSIWRNENE